MRTKTVGVCIVLLIIYWVSNKKYLLRSMSYGNYINLLNWNCRGLESLNQGHPNFAQLRAVLASCLELEGWISLIIAGLLFNMELQLMEISPKLESKAFLLPALAFWGVLYMYDYLYCRKHCYSSFHPSIVLMFADFGNLRFKLVSFCLMCQQR